MEKYSKCQDTYLKKTPRPRLSFSKKHRMSASPTTPIRKNLNLPMDSETSPASRNIRIVTNFGEESPSQDYDYSVFPLSQTSELLSGHRDVLWGLKDKNPIEFNDKEYCHMFPIIKKHQTKIVTPKKSEKSEGFYKFQKLLQAEGGNITNLLNKNNRIQLNHNNNEKLQSKEGHLLELDNNQQENHIKIDEKCKIESPSKKIIHDNSTPKRHILDKNIVKRSNRISNDINNLLLDDSETDNLLIELSQKIDCNVKTQPASILTSCHFDDTFDFDDKSFSPKSSKKPADFKMCDNTFEEDTIDELLLSLPLDEQFLNKLIESEKIHQNKKTTFARHNSMPSPNQTSKNFLTRHNSSTIIRLPEKLSTHSDKNHKIGGLVSSCSNSSTSLDSVNTTVSDSVACLKVCTKAEVEKKRQEAKLRRLESQRRQQILNQKKYDIKSAVKSSNSLHK